MRIQLFCQALAATGKLPFWTRTRQGKRGREKLLEYLSWGYMLFIIIVFNDFHVNQAPQCWTLAFQKKRMRPCIKQAVESLKLGTQLGGVSTVRKLPTNCGRQKCGLVHNNQNSQQQMTTYKDCASRHQGSHAVTGHMKRKTISKAAHFEERAEPTVQQRMYMLSMRSMSDRRAGGRFNFRLVARCVTHFISLVSHLATAGFVLDPSFAGCWVLRSHRTW